MVSFELRSLTSHTKYTTRKLQVKAILYAKPYFPVDF